MNDLTHKNLVDIAYKWILKRAGCGIAFKELKSTAGEIPDVIGFDSWHSIVVECKTCLSDFKQDKYKQHRKRGMGTFRFFCVPAGLITVKDLPDKWGLIYVENGKYRVIKDVRREQNENWESENYNYDCDTYSTDRYTNAFANDIRAEQKLLYTVIRRLFIKGFVKHIYDKQYNKSSTPDELILLNTLFEEGEGTK